MTSVRHSRLLQITGLLLSALVWLANNNNPPTGRTGAPFDGHCSDTNCHNDGNPNNYDGDVSLSGLPATIAPNTTYPITLTMSATAGSPSKGGFQVVAVDGAGVNAGDFTTANTQTGTEMLNGREYIEHRNGKTFSGGVVSWDFNWKSPTGAVSGNTVKFYLVGNFTNNNNSRTGDYPKSFIETYTLDAPPPVTATITGSTNVLCNGGNTGSATVEASGGVAPYTYLWSNGQTTPTAINLVANTYIVTVTGSSSSGTATASVTITQPPALSVSVSSAPTLNCIVTEVTATATASGGTPGYEYNWSNGISGNIGLFDTPGAYTVSVTDANGCTKTAIVNVTQNITQPIATVAPGGTLDCIHTQLTLSGVGSSQGIAFTYQWLATGGGNIVTGATTLTPTVNGCGTYTLTVTNNSNGCTATASTTVDCQYDLPDAVATNSGPLTCATTSVTLTGNSSVPGVSYAWTGPVNSNQQSFTTTVPGTYTLTVSNPANGCSNTAVTVVTQNTTPPSDTARVSGELTCSQTEVQISMTTNASNATFQWLGPNGFTSNQRVDTIALPGDYIGIVTNTVNGCKSRDTITVVQNITTPGASASVSGPITCTNPTVQLLGSPAGSYAYAWTGPDNFNSSLQNPMVNADGTYTLIVTANSNGCSASSTVVVLQNTTLPIASIAPPGNLNCNNTTIQLDATASSQGAEFSYLWTTPDGVIVSGGTTLTPVVSAAGTYNLLVTNTTNGCVAMVSTTVTQHPPVTLATMVISNVSCNGGSNGAASATATGGNGVYSYLWSTGATTSVVSGLAAGTYLVATSDGEGCTAAATVVITQPDPLVANASATGETALGANDGTATAAPTGGTMPYSYNWSNGGTTATITNLAPGSYTVSLSDANGCTAVQTVTVNAFGCSLSASITSTNATCNGANDGTAGVLYSGAAEPVTFSWSNGATTQNVTGLQTGEYTVSVVDANNCPAILNANITEPQLLTANATAVGETSTGANDGAAAAIPTGGTSPYSYLWSTGATTFGIIGLAPGTYTVVVTDSKGCTAAQSVVVSAFNCSLNASVTGANVSCFGGNDGLATIAVSGGQLPYTYAWSNGANTPTAPNLAAGNYSVVATDANGCTTSGAIAIAEPDELIAEVVGIQNVVCSFEHTGSVSIDASGGVAPYTYTGGLGNLGVGVHSVVVTDNNGCSKTVTFTIVATDSQPPAISCPANIYLCGADFIVYPEPTATDNCGALAAGSPALISGLPSGSVFNDGTTVQVYRATDVAGNSATCSFSIVVYPIPDILVNGSTDDHNGMGIGTISITAVGGDGNYLYNWSKDGQFFSTNEDLTGLSAGSYFLTVSDGNGCTSALAPILISNTVGTGEPGEQGFVRLSPNPASSSLNLEINNLNIASVVILNTRGQQIQVMQEKEWENEISVNNIATGVYFMRIATVEGRVITMKFVKSE